MGFISPKKLLDSRINTLFGPLHGENVLYCGMDEAGRGPWAGPVVACALVFKNGSIRLPGLKDSKKLSADKREHLYQKIARQSYFGLGRAEADEIDEFGLIKATKLAYERALGQLIERINTDFVRDPESHSVQKFNHSNQHGTNQSKKNTPVLEANAIQTSNNCSLNEHYSLQLFIDGRDKFNLPYPAISIIKGDEKVKLIACASIMAKVERDRIMCEMAKEYLNYGFEKHMGYGTALHQKMLAKWGICDQHRKSYSPVRKFIDL